MNKRVCFGVLAVAFVAVVPISKAFEPVSIAVGAVVITGVSKAADGLLYLFGPSKSSQDYEKRHASLKILSKKDFIDGIEFMRTLGRKSEVDILAQHELYQYEHFIEAAKESVPGYDKYIKALMLELDKNPKARLVSGFETDHLYHKFKGFFKKKAKDFSEFYRLVRKLYDEVLQREKQASENGLALALNDVALAAEAATQLLPS